MYEEYYGFVQPPFSLTPDPRFLYRSESHDVALQQVLQAIQRKEGFIVLTGDIGTGKTTICRTVLELFEPTNFTALILNPFVSIEELLREVLLSYGVASKENLRSGRLATVGKYELIRTLHDFLLSLVPIHGSAVLIIDEAQHLSTDVLEEIRILSNLETNERKLLQIILVGQLNLLDALDDAKLRQLAQRISLRCLLKALNREEVEAYITHRLWVARGSTAVTFTPRAVDLVHALSGGVPRIINLICDRALRAGGQTKTDKILEPHVLEGASALGLSLPGGVQRRVSWRPAAGRLSRVAIVLPLITLAAIGYVVYAVDIPLDLFRGAQLPAVPQPPRIAPPQATAPAPPQASLNISPPPLATGAYSVVVGTYDNPSQAIAAETTLRSRRLPVYTVDLPFPDGTRRRLLVGRYPTREEALAVRKELAPSFAEARVVFGWLERVR